MRRDRADPTCFPASKTANYLRNEGLRRRPRTSSLGAHRTDRCAGARAVRWTRLSTPPPGDSRTHATARTRLTLSARARFQGVSHLVSESLTDDNRQAAGERGDAKRLQERHHPRHARRPTDARQQRANTHGRRRKQRRRREARRSFVGHARFFFRREALPFLPFSGPLSSFVICASSKAQIRSGRHKKAPHGNMIE